MGQVYSQINTTDGEPVWIQRGNCSDPMLPMVQPSKVALSAQEWQGLMGTLNPLVKQIKNENKVSFMYIGLYLLPIIAAVIYGPLFLIFIPIFGVHIGIVICIINKNREIDTQISRACDNANANWAGRIRVDYRTKWTELCKPKGTRPTRVLVFVSPPSQVVHSGGAPAEMMTITCPEGVSEGQQLQIIAPSGQQLMVVVPAGVKPGQNFNTYAPVPQEVSVV